MSVPRIRLADIPDLTAVAACVHDAYAHYVARIGFKPAPMHADYADLITRKVVYVLTAPGGVIRGVLVLMNEDGAMFLENVAVHPHYQRAGLGRCLMTFAEEQARVAGVRELHLYTNEAFRSLSIAIDSSS